MGQYHESLENYFTLVGIKDIYIYIKAFSLPPPSPFPAAYVKTGHADELMSSQEGFPSM